MCTAPCSALRGTASQLARWTGRGGGDGALTVTWLAEREERTEVRGNSGDKVALRSLPVTILVEDNKLLSLCPQY